MPFSDVKITKSGNLGQIQSTGQDRIDFLEMSSIDPIVQ